MAFVDKDQVVLERLPERLKPACVVLSYLEGRNAPQGVVEHSFAMSRSPDFVNVWLSRRGAQSALLNAIVGEEIKFTTNGRESAEAYAKRDQGRNERLEVWDVDDPNLPIVIDWAAWDTANEPVTTTLSGVRDKFKARNAPFKMKEVDQ